MISLPENFIVILEKTGFYKNRFLLLKVDSN